MAVGHRGEIFLSNRRQKLALGVDDEGEEEVKRTILDLIYVKFPSFKKGVLERISACCFLHRDLYFYSKRYPRAQVAATIATLQIRTLKMSGSTSRYIALTTSSR